MKQNLVKHNPLIALRTLGQSIWLDMIRRGMLTSGELAQLIDEDGLRGVTANPSIFEKAIAGSHDYDEAVRSLALQGKSAEDIYESLAIEDIRQAADLFRPVYEQTGGRDGFVSLEVAPSLAHDTGRTVDEARRLWAALDRPNVMIKVPGTTEGVPAIRRLTSEGINVNVTLLFGLERYQEVAEAWLTGMEERAAGGHPIDRVASVASFFLSRIDVLLDPQLERIMSAGGPKGEVAEALHGRVAVASAKVAYQIFKRLFRGDRFERLAAKRGRPQRLLWASTSTKNPAYSDVMYVEALIGPDTVNTLPLETLHAYRDHGVPSLRIEEQAGEARRSLARLAEAGINLRTVTDQLEREGIEKFSASMGHLLATLEERRRSALREPIDRQTLQLGADLPTVRARLTALEADRFAARLWRRDPSLWTSDPKAQATVRGGLGWLHVAEKLEENLDNLAAFVTEVRAAGFRHVLHMGMGGSSLAPLVFARTFSRGAGGLTLSVLDTTDPATILAVERDLPLEKTLYIVASKSGTTAEPSAFGEYFYAKLRALRGDRAGEHFVAITDPGTPLAILGRERRFRRVFLNFTDIGGRYSALTYFGIVPAALAGVDVGAVLDRAQHMAQACAGSVSAPDNPGVTLGAVMGESARQGRDKVTLIVSPPVASLGMWLEQLMAESTGKNGTGVLPVDGEPLGDPGEYGADRLFAYLRLGTVPPGDPIEHGVSALVRAGHPVVTIQMDDLLDLGQEFFRWEIATATAGAVLRINAFDQPNVQESKDNTNRLLEVVRTRGRLPEETAVLTEGALSVYAQGAERTVAGTLARFLAQRRNGDYVAMMAYLTESPENDRALGAIRLRLRRATHLATTVGYGPRFLHSTGQYHKGGPNTGLFLQLTADDAADAPIPGAPYTFGIFKQAQALGDLEALRKHGRRVIRIHLGADVPRGLAELDRAVAAALRDRPR
jgi:transaldolase / glucose-6-phosphate isomerase